ncbi:hypothetical protein M3Y96_00150400 [Aphelenchoides besseyi]|nr:hypothetical protein M3Y96_00150400 [Aphelenchoides besseyi]
MTSFCSLAFWFFALSLLLDTITRITAVPLQAQESAGNRLEFKPSDTNTSSAPITPTASSLTTTGPPITTIVPTSSTQSSTQIATTETTKEPTTEVTTQNVTESTSMPSSTVGSTSSSSWTEQTTESASSEATETRTLPSTSELTSPTAIVPTVQSTSESATSNPPISTSQLVTSTATPTTVLTTVESTTVTGTKSTTTDNYYPNILNHSPSCLLFCSFAPSSCCNIRLFHLRINSRVSSDRGSLVEQLKVYNHNEVAITNKNNKRDNDN